MKDMQNNNKLYSNERTDNMEQETKRPELIAGDVIAYNGKQWKVTSNNGFMLSADNLDENDNNATISWIGNILEQEYTLIERNGQAVEQPIVAAATDLHLQHIAEDISNTEYEEYYEDEDEDEQETTGEQKIVGTTSYYATGEKYEFTDSAAFIAAIKEDLPSNSTSGFRYKVITTDAATRKAADDLLYDLFGEENTHTLEDYKTPKSSKKDSQEKQRIADIIKINDKYSFNALATELEVREGQGITFAVNSSFRKYSNEELREAVEFQNSYLSGSNSYSEPDLDIDETADEQYSDEMADNMEQETKRPELIAGDVIAYNGKQWKVTSNNGFMLSADNLDENDNNATISWIGGILEQEYTLIERNGQAVEQPIVAAATDLHLQHIAEDSSNTQYEEYYEDEDEDEQEM